MASPILDLRCLWHPHAYVKSVGDYLGQKSKREMGSGDIYLWIIDIIIMSVEEIARENADSEKMGQEQSIRTTST